MSAFSSQEAPEERLKSSRRTAMLSLLIWLVFGLGLSPVAWNFSHQIHGALSGVDGSAAEQVRNALVKNFSTSLAFPTAVIWDGKGLSPAEADLDWSHITDALKNSPGVTQVYDGKSFIADWPRPDWHAAFLELSATDYREAEQVIPSLRESIKSNVQLPKNHPAWITGGPPVFFDLNIASTQSLRDAEIIALPITFLILIAVFGSLVAAFLPVLVAGLGVVSTLGILSFAAARWPITFFVPNLVTMIGLGVGIDYSLIYLARYRREKARGSTIIEALQIAGCTAGHTVLLSAVLVMTGFLALFIIPLSFFHSIAFAGALVVVLVAAATLTFLPALIFVLGDFLECGRLFSPHSQISQDVRACYKRWMSCLLRYPFLFLCGGVVVLVAMSLPVDRLLVTSIQVNTLPAKSESKRGYQSMSRELGSGWLMPTIILEQHDPKSSILNPEMLREEKELATQLSMLPNSAKIVSLAMPPKSAAERRAQMALLTGDSDQSQTLLLAISKEDPQSPTSRRWMKQIYSIVRQHERRFPAGARYSVGGLAATTMATDDILFQNLPRVILLTLVTTFALLMYFMRSLFVPLKAILLNLLCVLAAYGFQVLWFQDGWGHLLGHFIHTDGLNSIVLVICFCTLFGLSMDYEVFILSAVRESWLKQHDMKLAIEDGLIRTSGIITSAALIMVSVFLSFAFGAVVETQQIGLGLSFAVLLDATLIRLVLAPAALALMGNWCWWLPFKKK